MKYIFFYLLILNSIITHAQYSKVKDNRPPVDFEAIENWLSVGDDALSPNGQYALYYINNRPVHGRTLVVASTKNDWKKEVIDANDAVFSDDGKKVIFKTAGDSLCIFTLGGAGSEYIRGVKSFKLFLDGKTEYLLYHLNSEESELVLRDMQKGNTKSFKNVENFFLSKNGNTLLLQSQKDKDKLQTLTWAQLPGGETKEIWQGKNAGNFVFDNNGIQLAFIVEQAANGKSEQVFWYYKNGIEKAVLLANNKYEGIDNGFALNGINRFSIDGTKLFFKLREPDFPTSKPDAVKVDVWSYMDARLQSEQIDALSAKRRGDGGPRSYLAVIKVGADKIIRLQQENETITLFDGRKDEFGFITKAAGFVGEGWSIASQPAYYLVSTRSGERRKVGMGNADWSSLGMSPDGKYIMLQKKSKDDLFSYEIATGNTRPITGDLHIPTVDENYDWTRKVRGLDVAAWTEDNKLLAYDSYDIWLLDPSAADAPVNLTNGYGRKHNLIFRLLGSTGYRDNLIKRQEKLVLCAFNKENKENGFYRVEIGKPADPKPLTMGAYAYYHPTVDGGFPMQPIKAKNVDTWLVMREDASRSPNLFITSDFKKFRQLSAVYPERAYNWFTTKLVNYQTLNGKPSQGILYLPDNLDTTKKNPLIIYYYEKLSQHLNDYKAPTYSPGWMEIPYFVSQGYVVFTPDIHFTTGHHAESTCNSVIGAAKFLMKFSWIDSTKMGIQGHSMGGFETNNLLTHTNIFAAASTAAGSYDLFSHSGELMFGNRSGIEHVRTGQYRMGAAYWERPDLYIENSPLFKIQDITTPVLIMHNKEDGAVPFAQGIEFFTALRRLGKRAWMLQYDGESHSVGGDAEKDLTIRMKQFFDHYLRDSLPPKWMTRGIPAKMKGIDDGLELDHEIKTPPEGGLLTPEERKRVDALQYRKPITITIQ